MILLVLSLSTRNTGFHTRRKEEETPKYGDVGSDVSRGVIVLVLGTGNVFLLPKKEKGGRVS